MLFLRDIFYWLPNSFLSRRGAQMIPMQENILYFEKDSVNMSALLEAGSFWMINFFFFSFILCRMKNGLKYHIRQYVKLVEK